MRNKTLITVTTALLIAGGLFFFISRYKTYTLKQAEPIVSVKTVTVHEKPIEVTFTTFGNIKAYATVEIKSRVSGPIIKMAIEEGQKVKKNDLLFLIDPRPFQAQLQRAEANLLRDQAQLEKAEFDFQNYNKLVSSGAVSKEQFQAVKSTRSTSEASVKGDMADLESAKLQLGYTEIRSPIDGIAGDFLTDIGSIVKADETVLVVINQIQPITVNFSVPAAQLHEIKKIMQGKPVVVRVSFPKEKDWIEEGKIVFIDNEIDSTTGTILMKAEFNNQDEHLIPGEYVNVTLVLQNLASAIVIPTEAIQKDSQQNTYVYIVKNDRAEKRIVNAIQISATESYITQGLSTGEEVVTDGIFQIIPGSKVKILR